MRLAKVEKAEVTVTLEVTSFELDMITAAVGACSKLQLQNSSEVGHRLKEMKHENQALYNELLDTVSQVQRAS